MTRRPRAIVLVALTLAVAVPPGIYRAACLGDTCAEPAATASAQPFCSLPRELRQAIANGYREGRSPEVMGVTGAPGLRGPVGPGWRSGLEAAAVPWPSLDEPSRVKVALGGAGITPGAIPGEASLADIAPTLAAGIGLERPHPEVRSGQAWDGLVGGTAPHLVAQVVWKPVSGKELGPGAARSFRRVEALGSGGEIGPGSLPADPAALMATLGSGGLPKEHGITGTYLRTPDGRLAEAWSNEAPGSVIAMLADDLGRSRASEVALIGDASADRSLTGTDWHLSGNRPTTKIAPGAGPSTQARRAVKLLDRLRLGRGAAGDPPGTDLLAVTMSGREQEMDAATGRLIDEIEARLPGEVLYVLVSLGLAATPGEEITEVAHQIESSVGAPVIEGLAGGGFFIDQEVLVELGSGEDVVLKAMDRVRPSGTDLFADRFTDIAIAFERYC